MPPRQLQLPRFKNPQARRRTSVHAAQKKPQYPAGKFKLEPFRGGIAITSDKKDLAQLYKHSARGFFRDPHAPKRAHVLEVASFFPGKNTLARSRLTRNTLHFLLDPHTMQHFIRRGIMGYVGYSKNPEIISFFQRRGGYASTLPVSPGRERFTEGYFNLRLQQSKRDPADAQNPVTFIFLPFPVSMTGMNPHILLSMINSLNRTANLAWERRSRSASGGAPA